MSAKGLVPKTDIEVSEYGKGMVGQQPLAMEAINPDIAAMIDTSSSASAVAFIRRLLTVQLHSSPARVAAELDRVFGEDAPSDSHAQVGFARPSQTQLRKRLQRVNQGGRVDVDGVGVSLAQQMVPVMVEAYEDMATSSALPDIPTLLGIIENLCRRAVLFQMDALYGGESAAVRALGERLSFTQRRLVKEQLTRYIDKLKQSIPFRKADESTDPYRVGRPDYVRRLGEHMDRSMEAMRAVQVPQEVRDMLDPEVTRVFFVFLMPWLVYKFVASFVPGAWNAGEQSVLSGVDASFHDRRYAELALYRATVDIAMEFRRLDGIVGRWSRRVAEGGEIRTLGLNASGDAEGEAATVHIFRTPGTYTLKVLQPVNMSVLLVGGGGGGGGAHSTGASGGGGGGGVLYRNSHVINAGRDIEVVVGAGGQRGNNSAGSGSNGEDSRLGELVAKGGGKGGSKRTGSDGGSGGGADTSAQDDPYGGRGVPGQGNDGGNALLQGNVTTPGGGGGGGGASQPGADGTENIGGRGGDGMMFDITGSERIYGGGGGGASRGNRPGAEGGLGGGGSAGQGGASNGQNGAPGTGGGGGAAKQTELAGNGGSGIVIVRYEPESVMSANASKMDAMAQMLSDTIQQKYVVPHSKKLHGFYDGVGKLSASTKHMSTHVQGSAQDLKQRRRNLDEILENTREKERLAARARLQFWVVFALYLLLLAAAAGLLLTDRLAALTLLSLIVILGVVALGLVTAITTPAGTPTKMPAGVTAMGGRLSSSMNVDAAAAAPGSE